MSQTGRPFRKILIANRGEIAVRIVRACRELGRTSVAVFSEADRVALHVRLADEARLLGPAPARESYLSIERVLAAAAASGADAIHPGYGFLAENAGFARACEDAGIAFIGPRWQTIELLGEKTSARREAVAAGLPVVPGSLEPLADAAALAREAERVGYPVMLKAAAGGGGKGLRLVADPAELAAALERARSEAKGAFGDERVYLEKALLYPRHVEVQLFGDGHGQVVQLFERECSVQRRHQKLIEESPSPAVTPELRAWLGELAVTLAARVGYRGAGTFEFLLDAERRPYFLEANTRLQVEHPVTELVTGLDLVKLQIRVAEGEPLPFRQADLLQRGHAIECRVYAEDPATGFLPSPGRIRVLSTPGGPGVRDDSGVYEGWTVPLDYDPLLSKLVVWAEDRTQAIERMRRALREYRVVGVHTTLPFLARCLADPAFAAGQLDTGFVDALQSLPTGSSDSSLELAAAAAAVRSLRDRRGAANGRHAAGRCSAWGRAALREAHAARQGAS